MPKHRRLAALSAAIFFASVVSAQGNAGRGWFFLSHTQELSKNWHILTDAQLRSADNFTYLTTLLLRASLNRSFGKMHKAGVGYTFKPDWVREPGESGFQPEHRVFEQYLYEGNLKKTEVTGRVRFEQRFVKPETEYLFSQRARAFLGFQIPLAANAAFSKGLYATLQNEIFLNVHNKQAVNNDFFDQNRMQGGLGYRWSKKLDTEVSYMYWRQSETEGYRTAHVVVLMVTAAL